MSGDPASEHVYHAGERWMQERAGKRQEADDLAAIFRSRAPSFGQAFLARTRTVVLGATDDEQRCWATLLTGGTGFVGYDSPLVRIAAAPGKADPIGQRAPDDLVGLLAIDMPRRRRLRVNGRVRWWTPESIGVTADVMYGNCAKYIDTAALAELPAEAGRTITRSTELTPGQRKQIAVATALFIASVNPAAGADASHRGGPPGFVTVLGPRRLVIPDYPGNNAFNTLGNIVVNPDVGLLFVSPDGASILQINGRATVADVSQRKRAIDIEVRTVVQSLREPPDPL